MILAIGISIVFLVVGPSFIKHGGEIRHELGTYSGYEYYYENKAKLYRKPIGGGEEEIVSEEAPSSRSSFFVNDGYAIYTSRLYNTVRINMQTGEETIYEPTEVKPLIVGVTSKYIVTKDLLNRGYIVIYLIDEMEIVQKHDAQPSEIKVYEEYVEFKNNEDSKYYRLWYEDGKIENIKK